MVENALFKIYVFVHISQFTHINALNAPNYKFFERFYAQIQAVIFVHNADFSAF